MNKNPTLWYTRTNGQVNGPFTASAIRNNLLLGRLNPMKDQASTDQTNWQLINTQVELHTNNSSDTAKRSKRNLDERNGFDRRHPLSSEQQTPQNRQADRRQYDTPEEIKRRQFRTLLMQKLRQKQQHIVWPLVAVFLLLISLIILAISFAKPFPSPHANCMLEPAAGVDWSNCLKPQQDLRNSILKNALLRNSQLVGSNLMNATLSGSDMAYSDLRFSNLSYSQMDNVVLLGANLKNADLSYADLSHSDLSYANLSNANLGGSKLDNVRFDHAIWVNGEICAKNSIGRCLRTNVQTP